MRIVVTGATGFVGKHLVEELVSQGNYVIAVVRDVDNIPDEWKNIESIYSVQYDALDGTGIYADMFYHFAWSGTSGNFRADVSLQLSNVQMACDMLLLAKKIGCKRFIHAGSIMEYDVIKSFSYETFAPTLSNIYSISKLTADYMCRTLAEAQQIEYVNVVISNAYGVGENSARFINTMLKKMMRNEMISLTEGTQKYDFIYVTDAARAIILAGERGKSSGNYYIGNAEQRILRDYVIDMHRIVGSKSELRFGDIKMNSVALSYDEFDTSRLEKEFGYKPEVSFEDGIRVLIKWHELEV